MAIDSSTMGDPARHRPLAELERLLGALPPAPRDRGRLALVVRKGDGGRREALDRVVLAPGLGLPGDAWGRHPDPAEEAQLTVMQWDVATLIANGQPPILFGDNLFLELDLSAENLPVGSRVRVGRALLEVTPKPHNGCQKFRARFGDGALRLTAMPARRPRNLRGIYMRVVEEGEVRVGDAAVVVSRPGKPAGMLGPSGDAARADP